MYCNNLKDVSNHRFLDYLTDTLMPLLLPLAAHVTYSAVWLEASELRRGLGKEIAGRVCLWEATI